MRKTKKRFRALHQLLDGWQTPDLDDPDVGRLLVIARVAETFHVLPTIVARDLDRDPERLSLMCMSLLQYAEAHDAEKRATSDDDMKAWRGNKVMDMVLDVKMELHKERLARAEARKVENGH